MRHVLAVVVRDQPGVLARVAALFSRRGFNIQSVAVGPCEEPGLSRMTLVLDEDEAGLEQVTKQLHKLVDVIKVSDISRDEAIERELVLVRVYAEGSRRMEVLQLGEIFQARALDVTDNSVILELTGEPTRVEGALRLLRSFGIQELARTGVVAIAGGGRSRAARPEREREGVRV
ncbi:MAG TPA: acetolactate synthase small subunit [Limnochordales bacterium]